MEEITAIEAEEEITSEGNIAEDPEAEAILDHHQGMKNKEKTKEKKYKNY